MAGARYPEFAAKLGANILAARKSRSISQEVLAKDLGISRPALANVEAGRQNCYIHMLVEISEILDCELRELLPNGMV